MFCSSFYESRVFVCRYLFLEDSLSLHETDVRTCLARGLAKSEFADHYSLRETREADHFSAATDVYAAAIRTLDLSALPRQFPCRDEERRAISAYLRKGVESGGGLKPMYVSGLPGTGKTASVVSCIEALRHDTTLTRKFSFLVINCLKLKSPNDAYSLLWKSISGVHLGQRPAEKRLTGHFDSLRQSRQVNGHHRDTPVTVCLVDEIDFLLTSNQNTLYNMFDWPMVPASDLVVVGLANTMDLPERFHNRIASRLGTLSDRMVFKPYSVEQIEQILTVRMGELNVFEEKSLKLATRKAATVAGDLRAALRICQRAIELHRNALREDDLNNSAIVPIPIQTVNRAANEYKQTPLMSMTRNSCPLYKAILVSVIAHNRAQGGSVSVSSDELHRRLNDTIHAMKSHPDFFLSLPPYSTYLECIDRMVEEGYLIAAETDRAGKRKNRDNFFGVRSVRLRLEASDVRSALKGDCFEKLL